MASNVDFIAQQIRKLRAGGWTFEAIRRALAEVEAEEHLTQVSGDISITFEGQEIGGFGPIEYLSPYVPGDWD